MPKEYKELTLKDPFMFGKVMTDPVNCKYVLESLMGETIEIADMPIREHFIQNRKDGKYIKLDLYAEDSKKRIFDAEMQNESKDSKRKRELGNRGRCYQSMIDYELMEKGMSYIDMKDVFIIFICTFDPFGYNHYKYTFHHVCAEQKDLILDDKSTFIFYNVYGNMDDASEEEKRLFEYIRNGKVGNDVTAHLEEAVNRARENEMWGHEYMFTNFHDFDIREEGREEGREEVFAVLEAINSGSSTKEELLELGFDEKLVSKILDYNHQIINIVK